MNRYSQLSSISDCTSSVNCIEFSEDGAFFAVGSDDGFIRIYDTRKDVCILELFGPTPVTALLWHPAREDTSEYQIIIGHGDGTVLAYFTDLSADKHKGQNKPERVELDFEAEGPVEGFAFNKANSYLAAIIGSQVFLCISLSADESEDFLTTKPKAIADPPSTLLSSRVSGSQISPRGVHFARAAKYLVVSYLEHGIICWDMEGKNVLRHIDVSTRIARSAMSPDDHYILVHNLVSGFDRYDLRSGSMVNMYTVAIDPEQNVSLPVLFIHGGRDLLLGDAGGNIRITDVDGGIVQQLPHKEKYMIQAFAYTERLSDSFLVTGTSEGGASTVVTVWHSVPLRTVKYRDASVMTGAVRTRILKPTRPPTPKPQAIDFVDLGRRFQSASPAERVAAVLLASGVSLICWPYVCQLAAILYQSAFVYIYSNLKILVLTTGALGRRLFTGTLKTLSNWSPGFRELLAASVENNE
ncbi:hypothetical protein EUX98_g2211 [Antrodiella citrinella]|uniref:Uncharacterized protein n=1 Tax=Antrodiella citrinella TaxID=2447956 RepID=A0A4S4MZM7_9APHY|nr:hypothetical protein EUX98_g2211 [Antrodiella citrinella]